MQLMDEEGMLIVTVVVHGTWIQLLLLLTAPTFNARILPTSRMGYSIEIFLGYSIVCVSNHIILIYVFGRMPFFVDMVDVCVYSCVHSELFLDF